MPITLNHTIVPSRDTVAAQQWFARIFGLQPEPMMGHFAPVRVNESLTFDFDNADGFEGHHYAFLVSDEEFDAIHERVKQEGIVWGSDPWDYQNQRLNSRRGGRGVYFPDPDGHLLELMTVEQSR